MRHGKKAPRGKDGPQNAARVLMVAVIIILLNLVLYLLAASRRTVVRVHIGAHVSELASNSGAGGITQPQRAFAAASETVASYINAAGTVKPGGAGSQQTQQLQHPSVDAFKRPAAGMPAPVGMHFSQQGIHQDTTIDSILQGMTGGFFVESGAFDGVVFSNTLFFEASRNWTGLLVEANPALFQKVLQRSNRTASRAINACLSPTGQHEQLEFILGDAIGGLSSYMSESHKQRIQNEIAGTPGGEAAAGPTNTGKTVSVDCWPLHAMMAALGKTRIDYWSLDTEGSEASILNATDFEALDIRVLTIEVNDGEARRRVESVMATKPYKLVKVLSSDLVYIKRYDPALAAVPQAMLR